MDVLTGFQDRDGFIRVGGDRHRKPRLLQIVGDDVPDQYLIFDNEDGRHFVSPDYSTSF
jgi:hypothetical protein